MLRDKKIKMLMGVGILLIPSMVFAETTTVTTDAAEIVVTQSEAEVNVIHGTANIDHLNVRSYPDTKDSTIMDELKIGDQVNVVYKVNNFYKVYINGEPGFVYVDYIDVIEGAEIEEHELESVRDIVTGECKVQVVEKENTVTSKGEVIVNTAMQYLGTPYVYGGSSLTQGTDCSGFTQGVMKLQGISIPRTSKEQSRTGQLVSTNEIQPGDLLFFGYSQSSIFHTGIYIGNGQMIHASTSSSGGVIIADAFTGGGGPLQVIRRVY